MSASARFEFRLRPEAKSRIEQAAALVNETASDFARTAAEERADEVLRDRMSVTVLPSDYFDQLLAALDEPPTQAAHPRLTAAARRAREIVEWR